MLPASPWCEYLHFYSCLYGHYNNTGIPYCMASVFLANKYPNQLPILFSPSPLSPRSDLARLRVVPGYLQHPAMCVTLSLVDEEKRSAEIDNHTTDDQSDALVRNKSSISFQLSKGS